MKILICDDDVKYANECRHQLLGLAKKHDIEITVANVESGNNLLFYKDTKYQDVDLIYMDFYMPGLNGLETALSLRDSGYNGDFILCTRDETHAIDGYKIGALDYFVKGKISSEKFEDMFLKAVQRCKKRMAETMTFSHRGDKRNIPIQDILYFEVQQQIVTVHYYLNNRVESFQFYSTLSEIQGALAEKGFVQNHKSYLVSKQHIRKTTYNQVEMNNGDILPIGRKYQANFRS